MSEKAKILSILDEEMTKWSTAYECSIQSLQTKLEAAQQRLDELEYENRSLKGSLEKTKSSTFHETYLLQQILQFSPIVTYDIWDHICLAGKQEDVHLLLLCCEYLLQQREVLKAEYILSLLTHKINAVTLASDEEFKQALEAVLTQVLHTKSEHTDVMDLILEHMLQIMNQLQASPYEGFMQGYIKQNFSQLADTIFETNEPKLIILFFNLLLSYQLAAEIREVLAYMLKVEWEFLESNLSTQELSFFLWYSYLFDLDRALLSASTRSVEWLAQETKEFALYNAMRGPVYDEHLLQTEIEQFRASSFFNQIDTEVIIQKVQKDVAGRKNIQKAPEFHGLLYVIHEDIMDSQQEVYNLKQHNLKKQVRSIPLYRPGNPQQVTEYAESVILVAPSEKVAFILEQKVRKLESLYKPYVVKALQLGDFSEKEGDRTQENNETLFNWPSTEVLQKAKPEAEGPVLNENGDLKKLGYQITGLTRDKRWKILQQAVPHLGLKRVANLIAYNVRLRKGQKNGISKYQYAITEWEYDLERLKKTYYKQDFTWPQT